jgi:succinyl-CoA synthetase alpha subunit
MTLGDDSLLYVVNSGLLSDSAGKLSIVDPVARAEVVVINGMGAGAGQAAFHHSGRLLIASLVKGILEVNTLTRTLTRGPGNAIVTGGQVISGLAIDEAGRVFAADPDTCAVSVLSPPPDYQKTRTPAVRGCGYSAAATTPP